MHNITTMKKYLLVSLLAILPLQFAFANTVVRTGDTVTIAQNQSVDGAFYAVGGVVALSGSVTGDAVIIGGNITVNGEVAQDLAILGGTVSVQAPVAEDLRIVAGDVTISKPIKGSLVVVSGRLTVLSTADISGDVLFYGGEGTIDGHVDGKVLGSSDSLRINGMVKGGVDVITSTLTLGDQANIEGDVKYTSNTDILRSQNSVVSGKILKNSSTNDSQPKESFDAKTVAVFLLISLFTTLSLFLIKRNAVERFARTAGSGIVVKLAVGFGVFLFIPVAAVIMMASMLGVVIGLILLITYVLFVLLALSLMSVYIGIYFAKLLNKKLEINIPLIVIGAIFLEFLIFLPVFGIYVLTLVFLATLGSLVVHSYTLLKN